MGKSRPKSPAPADPRVTAGAQTATNIGTAIAQQNLNNVNQVTPYGNLNYRQSGSHTYTDPNSGDQHVIPTYTATQTLSADQQAILDQENRASLNLATAGADQSARINELLSRPQDSGSLPSAGNVNAIRETNLQRMGSGPQLQTSIGDFASDRQRVEDALFERLNPQLERDKSSLENRLASQGIRIGSEAYQSAMDDFSRQSNDARLGAILNAGQEQNRLTQLDAQRVGFGNTARQQMFDNTSKGIGVNNQAALQETNADISRFDAANNARNQALNEQSHLRNTPINEIVALLSGSQIQNPNFVSPNTAQLATTDFAGLQANYDNRMMQNYQQQQASRNNLFGGLLGLGSNLLLSDERTKENIKQVGKTNDGQKIYAFRYKSGGPIQMGLMAQEVEKKKPEAVKEVGGVKMVDYGIALGRAA